MPVRPASTKPRPPGVSGIRPSAWATQKASRTALGVRVGADGGEREQQRHVVEGPAPDRGQQRLRPARGEHVADQVALAQQPLREARARRVAAAQLVQRALHHPPRRAQRRVPAQQRRAGAQQQHDRGQPGPGGEREVLVDAAVPEHRGQAEHRQGEHDPGDHQRGRRQPARGRRAGRRRRARASSTAARWRPRRRPGSRARPRSPRAGSVATLVQRFWRSVIRSSTHWHQNTPPSAITISCSRNGSRSWTSSQEEKTSRIAGPTRYSDTAVRASSSDAAHRGLSGRPRRPAAAAPSRRGRGSRPRRRARAGRRGARSRAPAAPGRRATRRRGEA